MNVMELRKKTYSNWKKKWEKIPGSSAIKKDTLRYVFKELKHK